MVIDIKKSAKTAVLMKRSAHDLGYIEDDYIEFFSTQTEATPITHMSIGHEGLGTYLRVTSIQRVMDEFFNSFKDRRVQLVVLGSGFSTVPFRYIENFSRLICFDHDLEETMRCKADIVRKNLRFKELLPDLSQEGDFVSTERYRMVPFDLNDLDRLSLFAQNGLNKSDPTLILSDYCLNYLKTDVSNQILERFAKYFEGQVLYLFFEPVRHVGPNDYFENVNLMRIMDNRYKELGWDGLRVKYANYFFNTLSRAERERVLKIENFDDLSLFGFSSSHFGVGLAHKNVGDAFFSFLCLEPEEVICSGEEYVEPPNVGNYVEKITQYYIDLTGKYINESVTF